VIFLDNCKTIKELADELNISKQAVRKHFDKMPTKLIPTKVDGRYMISLESACYIKSKVLKEIPPTNQVDSTINQPIDIKVDSIVTETLMNKLLKEKEDRISFLENQNENLNKLLDQQQQLTLQSNKQIEQLQNQLMLLAPQKEQAETEARGSDSETQNVSEEELQVESIEDDRDEKKWWHFWK